MITLQIVTGTAYLSTLGGGVPYGGSLLVQTPAGLTVASLVVPGHGTLSGTVSGGNQASFDFTGVALGSYGCILSVTIGGQTYANIAFMVTVAASVVVHSPLKAAYTNGQPVAHVFSDEVSPSVYATLSDTPPAGTASALAITAVVFVWRSRLTGAIVVTGAGQIVSGLNVSYQFSSADIAALVACNLGMYRGAVVATLSDGQVRAFDGLELEFSDPA